MFNFFDALQAGKELANPATWKNRQLTINLLVSVISMILFCLRLADVELQLTDEQLQGIAEAVAVILGLVNMFFTVATSKKVGL